MKTKTNTSEYESEVLEASYQKWVNQQFEKRYQEYCNIHQISLFCGTWNLNSKPLTDNCNLKEWLFHKYAPPADIYAIGFQEMVDLNVMNVVINTSTSDDMSIYWIENIFSVLNNTGIEYELICEKHMVGLEFLIFCKKSMRKAISDIRSSVVYTGGYGVTGNKGGISFRFDVYDSPFCFICAHFHANRKNVQSRNQDYQTIMDLSLFPSNSSKPIPTTDYAISDFRPFSRSFWKLKSLINLDINRHEHIFWIGDLNYRISSDLDDRQIFDLVENGDWIKLRKNDQLFLEKEKGNIFQNFEEGVINFPPTYKFQPGTNSYDQRTDKKLRAPAWCDRILWKTINKESVKLITYDSAPLHISDHKPVTAWFDCIAREINSDKAQDVYQDLLFSVDKWINASTPKLNIENRLIDFGNINVSEKYSSFINISNTGNVMCEWQFIPKNDELLICNPWIKIRPEEGILAPGESFSVQIFFQFFPEMIFNVSNKLNGSISLEEIVILRVTHGSDFFCIFNAMILPEQVFELKNYMSKAKINPEIAKPQLETHLKPIDKQEVLGSQDSDDEDEPYLEINDIYK